METEITRAASAFKGLVKRLEQALVTSGPITLERFAVMEHDRLEIVNKQINDRFNRISENVRTFILDQLAV